MRPEALEKLDRLEKLLAERTRIETEIEQLLGLSTDMPQEIATRPARAVAKTTAKNKGGRKAGQVHNCSVCGKPGHTVRTCPDARGTHPDNPRHEKAPDVRPMISLLNEKQYDELRDAMHDRDFMSSEFALTRKLSPREVNAAIRSSDYEDYLESR